MNNKAKYWWLNFDRKNVYFSKMTTLQQERKDKQKGMHVHHIIPQFLFNKKNPEEFAYCESDENKVFLTLNEHIEAHQLFNQLYPSKQVKKLTVLCYFFKIIKMKRYVFGSKKVRVLFMLI